MMVIISLFLMLAASGVHGQLRIRGVNDWEVQREMARPGEMEYDENEDLQFDLEITSDHKRPPKEKSHPEVDTVQSLFDKERSDLAKQAKEAGDDLLKDNVVVNITSGFRYYNLFDYMKNTMKNCPLDWNYECKKKDIGMPCFYNYNHNANKWEWCCPFWPRLLIAKCACCKCAVLTSSCAYQGECKRRYTKKGFFGVCYRNGRWASLHYFSKYLPSSCYCRI